MKFSFTQFAILKTVEKNKSPWPKAGANSFISKNLAVPLCYEDFAERLRRKPLKIKNATKRIHR